MRKFSLLHAFVLLELCWSSVLAQNVLDCFPTPEFQQYTNEAQEIKIGFSVVVTSTESGLAKLSLTTVLDRSGSMFGSKIDLLKKTTQFLVDRLAEDEIHRLGIVTYSDNVNVLVELQPVSTTNAGPIKNGIANIVADGRTFLSGGLDLGIQQQVDAPGGAVKTVYLFTDGRPNIGAQTAEDVVAEMRSTIGSSGPIAVSTFGFGEDLDIQLLKAVADAGGGEAYIITNEDDIPVAFGDALGGLLSVIAQNIDIVFKPTNGATIKAIQTGGDVSEEEGGIRVSFTNLFAGERRDMVFTLDVPAEITEVMDADVQFTNAITFQRVIKETIPVTIERAASVPEDATPDPLVEGTNLRFVAAEAVAEAQAAVDAGDTEGAVTAIAMAQAIVNVSPVEDDPTIQALQADVARILELLQSDDESQQAKSTQLSNFDSALTRQRASTVGGGAELETAQALDTEARKELREESKDAVLNKPPLPTPPPTASPPPTIPVINSTIALPPESEEADMNEQDNERSDEPEEEEIPQEEVPQEETPLEDTPQGEPPQEEASQEGIPQEAPLQEGILMEEPLQEEIPQEEPAQQEATVEAATPVEEGQLEEPAQQETTVEAATPVEEGLRVEVPQAEAPEAVETSSEVILGEPPEGEIP